MKSSVVSGILLDRHYIIGYQVGEGWISSTSNIKDIALLGVNNVLMTRGE